MISTENLQRCRTIADQMDDLLLEGYGAVNLLLPETGTAWRMRLAAAAWCHDFSLRTPSAALLDLADLADGRVRLRYAHRNAECAVSLLQLPGLLERLAEADVVLIEGMDIAAELALPALIKFLGRCAWRSRMTVAPVSRAAQYITHPSLCHLRMASDELIPTDVVGNQRAALIAATLIRQSGEGFES